MTAQPDSLPRSDRQRGPRPDVVVVGAGLAGSGMAAALAQRGWDVLLVERDRFPRHKVCGEFLSPEAQHSLQTLGLFDDVAALGPVLLRGAAITSPGGATIEMALPADAWGLSRYALDARLAATVEQRGGQVWQSATVTSTARDDEGYVLHVRCRGPARQLEEQILRTRAILMACGRHSSAALPPRTPARGADKVGWRDCVGLKIHYRNVRMEPRVELYLFPGGYVGINPVEGGRANVCLLLTSAAFQAAGKSLACVLDMAAARHPLFAERLRGADVVAETECAVAPVDTQRRPAPWDVATGAACIGDTAAMIPPLAGDGMAMALRSAELCLDPAHAFLQGTLSLDAWAAAYSRAWKSEFGRRLRLGQALQSALTIPGLGDVMAGLGQRLPWVAGWLLAETRGRII